jgi:hypothetical protein
MMMHGECETLRGARELSNLRPLSLRAHVFASTDFCAVALGVPAACDVRA